jgi:hypothetical protein
MKAFLQSIDKWFHYAAIAAILTWFVSWVFVMMNPQVQHFIQEYGFQTGAALLALSLVGHWLAPLSEGAQLESKQHDAIVSGFVGSVTLIVCAYVAAVLHTSALDLLALVLLTFVVFALIEIASAVFWWREYKRGYPQV